MRTSALSQEQELKDKGFVSFSSDPAESMFKVASSLGEIFKTPTMPLIQTLTPRLKENEHENTYSGNYGLNEFPFHTDLAHWYVPPRYLFMRCVCPAKDVATKIIDHNELFDSAVVDLLDRAHFRPRKRLDRKTNLLKILHGKIFRWDSIFIEPANKIGELLKRLIEERLHCIQSQNIFLNSVGDYLLIDNWRMLHGRGSVGNKSMDRKIERVYFNEVKF